MIDEADENHALLRQRPAGAHAEVMELAEKIKSRSDTRCEARSGSSTTTRMTSV